MTADEPKRRLSVHDVIGALGDLPEGEDCVSVIRKQRDAAGRPSVTDNARAAAEQRYPALNSDDEELTYPRSAVREHARGGFVAGYEAGWAAGRAETTTAHECDSGGFDRTICDCGAMHSYCTICGTRQDDCPHGTTTEPTQDGAR